MTRILMVAGGVLAVAGLLGIVIGIPVKEFSTGNLIIMSGVVALCSGLILAALAAVLAELQRLRLTVEAGGALLHRGPPQARMTPPPPAFPPPAAAADAYHGQEAFGHDDRVHHDREHDDHAHAHDDHGHDEHGHDTPPLPVSTELYAPEEPDAPVAPRDSEPMSTDAASDNAPPPWAKTKRREFFPLRPDLKKRAEKRTKPAAEESGAPPADFDSLWPARAGARRSSAPIPAPSAADDFAGASYPDLPPADAPRVETRESQASASADDHPPVTVLKSGVIDGMAYSLFSDGSIEAELADGVIHFNSLDELRAHLDRRV